MIRMVFDLNKGSFRGEKAVSCYTCHRGKPQPVSVPAVGQNLWQPNPISARETALPTVGQILDKYVQALGGAQAFQKVTTRIAKGSRIGPDCCCADMWNLKPSWACFRYKLITKTIERLAASSSPF